MPKPVAVPVLPADLSAMAGHAGEAAELLRVLASPHRLMILCTLAEGECSVGELNARIALSQSALSQHLSLLRNEGLVATRREAQTIYYTLVDSPAVAVVRLLHSVYCGTPDTVRSSELTRD